MNVENDEWRMTDGQKFTSGRSFNLRIVQLQAKAPEDWRTPRRWRVGRAQRTGVSTINFGNLRFSLAGSDERNSQRFTSFPKVSQGFPTLLKKIMKTGVRSQNPEVSRKRQ